MSRTNQAQLIKRLAATLKKECAQVQIFETHISWVLVTDKFAYKFKKALHFDFLNFSTLDARHFYCQEEYRLNQRLAPDIYVGVVAVTGSAEHPVIGGSGIAIEYAVKMHAFQQQALWNYRIQKGYLSAREIDLLARKIAHFHCGAATASSDSWWGMPDALQKIAADNLRLIATMAMDPEQQRQIRGIEAWQLVQHRNLIGLFENRKACGMIRECHGDLHSRNILTVNDQVEVFDCIEFNESLRWIDVINDIAFIYMELEFLERRDMAARLLNQYLEITGDYEGLGVLRYYQIERALVRCKVDLLHAGQLQGDAQKAASHQRQADKYLAYAVERCKSSAVAIMITHGYSGSGKSTFSRCLVELVGAIQIRSDVERKRLHGVAATSRISVAPGTGLYESAVTERTYERLCQLARQVVESGLPVIVDAAFLRMEQRKLFENLAQELDIPFFIIDMKACETTLKRRIQARASLGQDPSDAGLEVLAQQLAEHDPFSVDEEKHVIVVDCDYDMDTERIRKMAIPVVNTIQSTRIS